MSEIKITCINFGCNDETDHLNINVKKGVFNCFKCGWGGKIVYNKDIQNLLKKLKPIKPVKKKSTNKSVINTNDFVKLTDLSDNHQAIIYINNRGINISSCSDLSGYYAQTGVLSGRVVFPIKLNNIIVGWQGRSVCNQIPKYLTYGKKNLGVFSLKNLNEYKSFIILFEGVFDILKIPDYGIALLGKKLSREQLRIFTAFLEVKTIFVMLDSDASSYTLDICNELSEFYNTVPVILNSGDPGDLSENEILKLCKNQL